LYRRSVGEVSQRGKTEK